MSLRAALARGLYATALRAATPAYLARLWWRGGREPAYRQHWSERLGLRLGHPGTGRVWVHAVSLGETRAAAALVDALRERLPGMRLLLTHGTATGREAGRALLREGDLQAWLPYDSPGAVRRFLRAHRPALGVLMETEVWPTLLEQAQALGVTMVLANARLSERSLRKGRRLQGLMRPAAARFTAVLAQTHADAERLSSMGARGVAVMGNVKFDMTPDASLLAQGRQWHDAAGRPVVMAAATREGEEEALLQAWRALPQPRPLLLVVPRHPQRFDEVAALVTAQGWALSRRSTWGEAPPAEAAQADVWLGDSMREMPAYYACADAALLGGSFAPLGGQNLIEAAACGCPLVMGPHTFNFSEAAELALQARAAWRVPDIDEGVRRAVALATDPQRHEHATKALAFASAHRGAAARMADAIVALLRSAR